ncbi:MAG TPA: type II toxin-antitoxin system prevent-host-death family antitoxin [Thermoanaerobaculia bacterium]|nr:type II toxin-antitoxin system prevent-host-death family antitoxin [Thermoanaerobaculia bacterium]
MKTDVGIRELRQNLSKYIRRVVTGTTLRVLERGRPVAILAPVPEKEQGLDRLFRERKAIPAKHDLAKVSPLPRRRGKISLSRTLGGLREERLR